MAATEVSICNLALARVGQRQPITSLDPAVDASEMAAMCALLYPAVRDALLSRFPWPFATRSTPLQPDPAINTSDPAQLFGYAHAYTPPADLLVPQRLANGARPGQPVYPWADSASGDGVYPGNDFIDALARDVPFEALGTLGGQVDIFTDLADDPQPWDASVAYPLNFVVSYQGGVYRATDADNLGVSPDPNGTTPWIPATDPSWVTLIYTAQVTTPTLFPQIWVEALTWRLASDLALSLATKDAQAARLEQQAELTFQRAMAAFANAMQPDRQADSSFITVRG